jgi:hypothetical protein
MGFVGGNSVSKGQRNFDLAGSWKPRVAEQNRPSPDGHFEHVSRMSRKIKDLPGWMPE